MVTEIEELEKILVNGPDDDNSGDDGCDHGDYSEGSDADSSDTDAG